MHWWRLKLLILAHTSSESWQNKRPIMNVQEYMKKLFALISVFVLALGLAGCLASTTSPIGLNCDYSKGIPIPDMPVDCQGH
ncbi:hypothetical protein Pnuc_2042 [Polynucleobacter asymbioticus QLW-P1DMWA-1]|uniref:Uncharacterized protein n=2 Tax=Polynucleobacter asymbioticus TaxID=576611 RepID=A4T0I9_POLAQ|nr:hypothetical protein Pnuc_2042 [Polynucleobacter asymbioticus QLW-P1DMWA-1]